MSNNNLKQRLLSSNKLGSYTELQVQRKCSFLKLRVQMSNRSLNTLVAPSIIAAQIPSPVVSSFTVEVVTDPTDR